MIAFSRPFWPLFLHILGAMTLYGTVIAALVLASTRHVRATFTALLLAIPSYVVLRVFAQVILSDEDYKKDPAWVDIGFIATEPGLVVLLATIGAAYWWKRTGKPVAGRIVTGLAAVYLVLLTVAMLAMSGRWG